MVDAMDESQTYNIVVDKNIGQSDIFALKLTDDVIQRISAGQTDLKHLKGIEFVSATTGDFLKIGEAQIPLVRVKESQPVHLYHLDAHKRLAQFGGRLECKLNPKFELEKRQAEAIRQRGQIAEQERLSRKTLAIDAPLLTKTGKSAPVNRTLIKRSSLAASLPSSNASSPEPKRRPVRASSPLTGSLSSPSVPSTHLNNRNTPPLSSSNLALSHGATAPAAKKPATAKDRLAAILKKRKTQ